MSGCSTRVRALSLHLFEHIHGESRDRGQAMVNLLESIASTVLSWMPANCPTISRCFWNIWRSARWARRWTCWPMPCTSWRCSALDWLNRTAITMSCSTRWPPGR